MDGSLGLDSSLINYVIDKFLNFTLFPYENQAELAPKKSQKGTMSE
jgi:hypothetical protein